LVRLGNIDESGYNGVASRNVFVTVKDVDWQGKDAVDRLRNMRDRASDMGPVLRWGRNYLEKAYSKNFTTMGSMSAKAMLKGAWPPLDDDYAFQKAERYPGAPPMMITGELFRSVANMASSPKNQMTEMEGTFVIDSPIARFHQYGTRDMPARKILFIPRDFDRDINKKTIQYIVEGSKLT
jgi:hypothetical protein